MQELKQTDVAAMGTASALRNCRKLLEFGGNKFEWAPKPKSNDMLAVN